MCLKACLACVSPGVVGSDRGAHEQNIGGFQVCMDDAHGVQVCHPSCYVHRAQQDCLLHTAP